MCLHVFQPVSVLAICFEEVLFLYLPCAVFFLQLVYVFIRFPSKGTKSDAPAHCLLASLGSTPMHEPYPQESIQRRCFHVIIGNNLTFSVFFHLCSIFIVVETQA